MTWSKAADLFEWWLAGKVTLGEKYDRYRETMVGFERRTAGEAWEGEDRSSDTGFNVEDFERWKKSRTFEWKLTVKRYSGVIRMSGIGVCIASGCIGRMSSGRRGASNVSICGL